MPNDTLPKIDFTTMLNGLESRSPFLDHKLAEYAFSIPYKYKVKGAVLKYILKCIGEKYLPSDIVHRKKQGFSVPLDRWFRKDLNSYVKDTLLSRNSFVSNFLRTSVVEKLLENHKSGTDYSNHIWVLLTLEKWGNNYVKFSNFKK